MRLLGANGIDDLGMQHVCLLVPKFPNRAFRPGRQTDQYILLRSILGSSINKFMMDLLVLTGARHTAGRVCDRYSTYICTDEEGKEKEKEKESMCIYTMFTKPFTCAGYRFMFIRHSGAEYVSSNLRQPIGVIPSSKHFLTIFCSCANYTP